MEFVRDIFHNEPLVTAGMAWLAAALMKFFIVWIWSKRIDWERLLGTGGMPSTHTTPVVGCVTSIGLNAGWDSPLFALGFVMVIIVAYDATGIRRHAGEQARAINSLLSDLSTAKMFKEKNPADFFKRWNIVELQTLLGHNPMEVLIGVILGILVALTVDANWELLPPLFNG